LAVEAADLMLNVIVMGLKEESGAPSPCVAFLLAAIKSGLRCNTMGGGILVVAEHDLVVNGAVDKVFRLVTSVTGSSGGRVRAFGASGTHSVSCGSAGGTLGASCGACRRPSRARFSPVDAVCETRGAFRASASSTVEVLAGRTCEVVEVVVADSEACAGYRAVAVEVEFRLARNRNAVVRHIFLGMLEIKRLRTMNVVAVLLISNLDPVPLAV
jgi:hypothetical protein